MKKIIIPLFFLVLTHVTFGQGKFNLTQFYASKNSRNPSLLSTSERIDSLYHSYLLYHGVFDPDRKLEDFAYQQNFFMDRLNRSGAVLSNNEISVYLNRLKDLILQNEKDRNYIQVYLTDFGQLNAFTNDFGSIYVNIATIAKLTSEEELIAVLAHEISHVLSRHSIKFSDYIENGTDGKFQENKIEELSHHRFSQKQELEADSMSYELLRALGINFEKVKGVFEHLEHDQNPALLNRVNICQLSGRISVQQYLCQLDEETCSEEIVSALESTADDSLSTHPSITARKELFESFNFNTISPITLTDEFLYIKQLASFVMIKTYLTEGDYIDALYLILQLKQVHENDVYLIKSELKALMLITQEKYDMKIPIVNVYGTSCNDTSYLNFRRAILKIPALEMNLIVIQLIEDYKSQIDDPYIERLEGISHEFFYKNNPSLFGPSENGIKIRESLEYKDYSYVFHFNKILGNEDSERLEKLKKLGYIIIEEPYLDTTLADSFFSSFTNTGLLNEAAKSYRQRRNEYETTLTVDMLFVEKDLDLAIKKYRKGQAFKFDNIDPASTIALGGLNVSVVSEDDGNAIEPKSTIHLEEQIVKLLREENTYDLFFAGAGYQFISNTISGYDRRMMDLWFSDGFKLKDLVYSSSDEEINAFRHEENIDLLAYHSVFTTKTRFYNQTFFYTLYFDMETMGVVYVNKMIIKNKKDFKDKYLRHYLTTITNASIN